MPLTAQDVAEIARLLEQSDFLELHLEHEGFKLTLRRSAARRDDAPVAAATSAAPAAAAPPAAALQRAPGEVAGEASLLEVTAPLLGIFYRAPRPGAPPYVDIGSEIVEDSIVGIIEVMKLMNSVRAGVRGTVAAILIEDGATVEYGQVLLRVARAAQHGSRGEQVG